MTRISVIMPAYNRAHHLELTLVGYTLQTYKDFEIIVVDDGSTDETRQVAESFSDTLNLRYLYQPNSGRSRARNRALDEAVGEVLIFNDHDRIPGPDFLQAHLNRLQSNQKRISVGQKQEVISFVSKDLDLLWDDRLRDFIRRNPAFLAHEPEGEPQQLFGAEDLKVNFQETIDRHLFRTGPDNFDDVIEQYGPDLDNFIFGWAMCTTGNLALYRPKTQKDVLFDEAYTGWGLEDTDFGFRLQRKGYQIVYCANATNFHQIHCRSKTEKRELVQNLKTFWNKFFPSSDSSLNAPTPGSNIMSLYIRFMGNDYTLPALNQLALELRRAEPQMFMKDYLWLSRMRAKGFLRI